MQYLDDHSSKSGEAKTIGNWTPKAFQTYKVRRKQTLESPPNSSAKIRPEIGKRQNRSNEVARMGS